MEKLHYSYQTKMKMLENVLDPEDAKTIVALLDCCTFDQLKELSEWIKVFSDGK